MDSSQQLYRKRLSYNTLGDHIEEIRFSQPVSINAFWVGNACTGGPGQAVLRAYAKDTQGPCGSRFVPLCSSTVTCPEDGFASVQTEAITTDCIIVRGRYKQVDIHFRGKRLMIATKNDTQTACQDTAALQPIESSNDSQKVGLLPLHVEDPCLPFADGFSGPVAYALASIVGFEQAASSGRVPEMEPPAGAVQELFSVADNLCKLLGGAEGKQSSGDDVEHVASSGVEPAGVSEGLYVDCAELSIQWIKRLCWLGGRGLALDVKKGMIGLATALVLCSCRESAVHFLANGGVEALAEAFRIRRVTARMVRYLTCTCEMVTLTTSSLGCEALLGWWAPPERRRAPRNHALTERVSNHEERDVIHVPGILQVKVRVKKDDHDVIHRVGGVCGKDGQGIEPQHRSLPPGMVLAKPQDPKSTRSQGSRVSPIPDGPSRQSIPEEFSDGIWPRRSADRSRHKGKRKLAVDEEYEDHGDPTLMTTGRIVEHQTSPYIEKDLDNQANKGSDYKSRHGGSEKKDGRRETERRKDRKKHKSHHKDKGTQSPNEQERMKEDDRHDHPWQEHEKAREPDEGHSKHKKRRHDERRKERRKSGEESHRRDAQEDAKIGSREVVGEGVQEKAKDKERKRQRRKGKSRGREREKDQDGRQDGTSMKSAKHQDVGSDMRCRRENGSTGVHKDSGKLEALPSAEKDRGLKRQRSMSCDRQEDNDTKLTCPNAPSSKTVDGGSLAGPLMLPLTGVDLYDVLVDLLMQPRAEYTVLCTSRTILRLNAYKSMVDFQGAIKLAREKAESGSSEEIVSHLQQGSSALKQLSIAIQTLSNISRKRTTAAVRDDGLQGLRASFGSDLDACVQSCLSSQNFLASVAVMLKIPSSLPSNSEILNTRMRQAIHEGFRSIIVQLTSSSSGLSLLRHHMCDVLDMVSGLGQHWHDEDGQKMGTMDCVDVVEEVVILVGDIMRACEAVDIVLSSRIINSVNGARAVSTLTEMLSRGATRQAAILPMGLTPKFIHHLLGMAEYRLDFQKKLAKSRTQLMNPDVDTQETVSHEPFQWSVLPVLDILLEMSCAGSIGPVSRICESATDIIETIEAEQKQIEIEKESELSMEALELLGRSKMCLVFNDKGCSGVMEKLGVVLPKPAGNDDKKSFPQEINSTLVVQLLQSAENSGMVLMGVDILASYFSGKATGSSLSVIYCASTLSIFSRILQCAIDGVLAAQADGQWMLLGGDFRSEMSVTHHKERAVMLMRGAANLLDAWSSNLQKNRVEINAAPLLTALIRAQSFLTTMQEGLRAMRGAASRNCGILKARHSIATVLSRWVEMEWGPDVILTVFKEQNEVTNKVASYLEPKRMFCTSCLLGDIFPTEWPPAKNLHDGLKSFPPPTNIKTRATLARSLEPCAKQFRHIVEFSLGCESQLMRCTVVRMCARAAGLGGGMGCFLAEPFIEEVVRLSRREIPISTDHYRIAEYLLALCMWPAMKAAFLDLKATSFISRLLRFVAPKCREEPAAILVADMIVKVLSWLCDPDICLNSLTTVSERLRTDHPSVPETSNVVAALLSNLIHLEGSSEPVIALLTRISSSALGKAGIISGLGKWHSAQLTASGSACTSTESSQASISWAMKQLEEQSSSEEGASNATQTCATVAKLLKSLENFAEAPFPEDQGIPTAPNRFKSAVQAAVQFAASSSGESDSSLGRISTELPNIHPLSLIFDASTQHYWRLCKTQESLKSVRKNWARWPCESPSNGPVTSLFAQGLAGASRPRQVQRGVYLSRPGEENVSHIHRDDPMLQMVRRADDIGPEEIIPDLPPVFAPPRRGQEARRMRMGIGSSRPPSIHVDAFQKRDGPHAEQGGGELPTGDVQDVGSTKQEMVKAPNLQGEAVDQMQDVPEPSGAIEEKGLNVPASVDTGGSKEAATAPLPPPPKSKPFTISLPPRVRKEPPPPPPPPPQPMVPQEPLPADQTQSGNQTWPDEQHKAPVQMPPPPPPPAAPDSIEKIAGNHSSEVSTIPQAVAVSMEDDVTKRIIPQSIELPPKPGPSTLEARKESMVPGIDFTEDVQEDGPDSPLGNTWDTGSPQAPQLSPENSGAESGEDKAEVPPGVSISGPPSPDISMLVRGQEGGSITKDSVKCLLHDPSQMREILKQHPQLVAALQARLNQSKSNAPPSQGTKK